MWIISVSRDWTDSNYTSYYRHSFEMRNNDNLLLQYYMIWDYGCWEEEMEKNGRHRRSRTVIRSINKKQEIGHERKRREEMRWEQRRKARKSDYRETWRKDPILIWYLLYFLLRWCTVLCSALLSSVLQLYRLIAYNGFTTIDLLECWTWRSKICGVRTVYLIFVWFGMYALFYSKYERWKIFPLFT